MSVAVAAPGCVRSTYPERDVTFLLTDLTDSMAETPLAEREARIQSGGHYSEMLPIEYVPSQQYQDLFSGILTAAAADVARSVGIVTERMLARRDPERLVLASLARAGTPVGILILRYLRTLGFEVPHYTVSIIRDRGIDEAAIRHMTAHHPDGQIQFVDGWTGKGAIARELQRACEGLGAAAGLDPTLAVVADPGDCTTLFGTRRDTLLPSACLNATVSGLVSRTVYRPDLTGDGFHGAKFYGHLVAEDVSNLFVDAIEAAFPDRQEARDAAAELERTGTPVEWSGAADVRRIADAFGMPDINLVKPGAGETLRVLLRRMPWRVLVRDLDDPMLEPILLLAAEKGIPVEPYPDMSYGCCGLIRPEALADA